MFLSTLSSKNIRINPNNIYEYIQKCDLNINVKVKIKRASNYYPVVILVEMRVWNK